MINDSRKVCRECRDGTAYLFHAADSTVDSVFSDKTPGHSTSLSKYVSQVAGYGKKVFK